MIDHFRSILKYKINDLYNKKFFELFHIIVIYLLLYIIKCSQATNFFETFNIILLLFIVISYFIHMSNFYN